MPGSSPFLGSLASAGRVFLLGLYTVTLLCVRTSALSFVAGGPCEAVCNDKVAGTVHDDVRCLYQDFAKTPASHVKQCVACQLNSTAIDPVTRATDVQWGLFHLRYSVANCMFGYPEERVSISSPCQVSCAPLQKAIAFGIANSTTTTNFSADLGFCTGGQFDDFTINNCAFCYSFIPQQLILGNFLQALHIACNSPPVPGKAFYPDAVAIFNASTIAGPTGPTQPSSTSSGLEGSKLILAIVLPLVGGIAILVGVCWCCWHFTRRRRARMTASGRMSKFRDHQEGQDFSPMSPMTPKTSPPQPFTWSAPVPQSDSPKMAESRFTETNNYSTVRDSPNGSRKPRWLPHTREMSSEPLNPNKPNPGYSGDTTSSLSELKDPNLHEQFIGGHERSSPPTEAFRAQDGFVHEDSHGGWRR